MNENVKKPRRKLTVADRRGEIKLKLAKHVDAIEKLRAEDAEIVAEAEAQAKSLLEQAGKA